MRIAMVVTVMKRRYSMHAEAVRDGGDKLNIQMSPQIEHWYAAAIKALPAGVWPLTRRRLNVAYQSNIIKHQVRRRA